MTAALRRDRWTVFKYYAVAALLPVLAVGPTELVRPALGGPRLAFFFGAVALSAWYGGLGPGLVTTALSILIYDFLFVEPVFHFRPASPADVLALAMFSVVAIVMSALSASLRDARRRAEEERDRANELAEQLQVQAIELEHQAEQLQSQTVELEQQTEEAQALAEELELANQQLREMVEETRAAQRRVTEVLDSLSDATSAFDREWRFTYLNPQAAALLRLQGKNPDAILGRILWDEIPALVGTKFQTEAMRAVAERRMVEFEENFPPLDLWFELRVFPTSEGVVTYMRNVTARKHAEEERERLLAVAERTRREADAANRAKSEFLAVMSHELRTPLNAIAGYVELLDMGLRGPVTEAQREDLARIRRSQQHLLRMINDVLNFARIEAGRVAFDIADVPVDATLADLEALIEPQVRAKELRFRYRGCDPAVTVRADRDKLQQIVLNLLSNAVKFTDAGGEILLDCDVREGEVAIQVCDTGRGIAPGKLEAIFEPFVQLEIGPTRRTEGAGLGLAISRELARSMGGELSVTSRLGQGSIFTLRLPRAAGGVRQGPGAAPGPGVAVQQGV